jgi:hypothetical protein
MLLRAYLGFGGHANRDWFSDADVFPAEGRPFLAHHVAETHIGNMMVEADTGCRQDQGSASLIGAGDFVHRHCWKQRDSKRDGSSHWETA